MTNHLSLSRLSVPYLKKKAKSLFKRLKARERHALHVAKGFLPKLKTLSDEAITAYPFALADAQYIIANTACCDSWPKLMRKADSISDSHFRFAVDSKDRPSILKLEECKLQEDHPFTQVLWILDSNLDFPQDVEYADSCVDDLAIFRILDAPATLSEGIDRAMEVCFWLPLHFWHGKREVDIPKEYKGEKLRFNYSDAGLSIEISR